MSKAGRRTVPLVCRLQSSRSTQGDKGLADDGAPSEKASDRGRIDAETGILGERSSVRTTRKSKILSSADK